MRFYLNRHLKRWLAALFGHQLSGGQVRGPGAGVLFLSSVWVLSASLGLAQYADDGQPTGLEEEIRWRANRGRFDTASENRARGTSYVDVSASAGPLAPHQALSLAARHHSEDMAKHNIFQHATIPGSAYYNATTQPNPWDRMVAEGYAWNSAAENIAAGYPSAEAAYVGWWNSTGHRKNMYNSALREIGNGYYYYSSSTYRGYYTMDLGSSGSHFFFTDTLFQDANGSGTYDQGEGRSGIAVLLRVDGTNNSSYDISASVGSFAVPIQSIHAGAKVFVTLSNTTPSIVSLSLPRDYQTYTSISLAAREIQTVGFFTQPTSARNFGFRDLAVSATGPNSSSLAISSGPSAVRLSWPSQAGVKYVPQWTMDLRVWNNLEPNPQSGTGSNLTCQDSSAGSSNRFYRLLILSP